MSSISTINNLLGLKYPIVQGPFGGLSTVELVSTVSNFGALGSYGAHYDSPDKIAEIISAISERTSNPFAINLWVSDRDTINSSISEEAFNSECSQLLPIFELMDIEPPRFEDSAHIHFEDQVEAALSQRPPILSFIYGVPDTAILEECRRNNIVTIGTATTVDEAVALEEAGLDAIVATGFEAGGHRPAFLDKPEAIMIGTFSLIQQVSRAVSVPVIAAGGIVDGNGVNAALLLGAQGAQIGTAFLACNESGASEYQKEVIRHHKNIKTVLSRSYTGRLCRYVENGFLKMLPGRALDSYPLRYWVTRSLRAHANSNDVTSVASVSCGQSVDMVKHDNVHSLLKSIVDEMSEFKSTSG